MYICVHFCVLCLSTAMTDQMQSTHGLATFCADSFLDFFSSTIISLLLSSSKRKEKKKKSKWWSFFLFRQIV